VTDVKKLVDDVFGGEAPRVVDRRLATGMIGYHADQAVADPADLVAYGPDRDSLGFDCVALEPEPGLPACEPAIDCR
jgi:hypothetical protein